LAHASVAAIAQGTQTSSAEQNGFVASVHCASFSHATQAPVAAQTGISAERCAQVAPAGAIAHPTQSPSVEQKDLVGSLAQSLSAAHATQAPAGPQNGWAASAAQASLGASWQETQVFAVEQKGVPP
jgi:hypothetical protein